MSKSGSYSRGSAKQKVASRNLAVYVPKDKQATHKSNLRAKSRPKLAYTPEERARLHLRLKNYLLIRHNQLKRLNGTNGEPEAILEYIDYLRSIE